MRYVCLKRGEVRNRHTSESLEVDVLNRGIGSCRLARNLPQYSLRVLQAAMMRDLESGAAREQSRSRLYW